MLLDYKQVLATPAHADSKITLLLPYEYRCVNLLVEDNMKSVKFTISMNTWHVSSIHISDQGFQMGSVAKIWKAL